MMHLTITVSKLPHDITNFCFFVNYEVVHLFFLIGLLLLDMLDYIFAGVYEVVPFRHLCNDILDYVLLLLLFLSFGE